VVKFNVEKIDEGSSPNNWSPWVWPHQGIDAITGMGEVTVLRGKEQEFSGFKILISRDTLKKREQSIITLIAIDEDSNEVDIDGSARRYDGQGFVNLNELAPDGRTFLDHLTEIMHDNNGTRAVEEPIHYEF
jgi:hypothetical protein